MLELAPELPPGRVLGQVRHMPEPLLGEPQPEWAQGRIAAQVSTAAEPLLEVEPRIEAEAPHTEAELGLGLLPGLVRPRAVQQRTRGPTRTDLSWDRSPLPYRLRPVCTPNDP